MECNNPHLLVQINTIKLEVNKMYDSQMKMKAKFIKQRDGNTCTYTSTATFRIEQYSNWMFENVISISLRQCQNKWRSFQIIA